MLFHVISFPALQHTFSDGLLHFNYRYCFLVAPSHWSCTKRGDIVNSQVQGKYSMCLQEFRPCNIINNNIIYFLIHHYLLYSPCFCINQEPLIIDLSILRLFLICFLRVPTQYSVYFMLTLSSYDPHYQPLSLYRCIVDCLFTAGHLLLIMHNEFNLHIWCDREWRIQYQSTPCSSCLYIPSVNFFFYKYLRWHTKQKLNSVIKCFKVIPVY